MRLLFIGQFPPPEGGVTILVKCLFDELSLRSEIRLDYIDIAQPRLRLNKILWPIFFDNILALLLFFLNLLIKIKKNDVITLHVSTDKLVYYGLITVIVSKLFSKKLIIRKFGGTDYNSYDTIKSAINRYILKNSDSYFCETKVLLEIAKNDGLKKAHWFPNHRKLPDLTKIEFRTKCKKGIFLGLVNKEKGVFDLCEAAEIAKCLHIDIWGRMDKGISYESLKNYNFCTYKGIIEQKEIFKTLNNYDVLFLPSYREGYPGVIIEAIGNGIPVIVSTLPSISEMLDDKAGIYVEPGNISMLTEAIRQIYNDEELYNALQIEARKKSFLFSVDYWADHFLLICNTLIDIREN